MNSRRIDDEQYVTPEQMEQIQEAVDQILLELFDFMGRLPNEREMGLIRSVLYRRFSEPDAPTWNPQ
ncbi:hypothetical protein SAMN03159463_05302 [Mesorhizobium sp. NFR06]|uniref:hypothetical protein n=1 Tax=Mesorhizobium sp. NFR06 TaxID=1566290 RepID=UPI0008EEBB67|nr:hypothetical protein [Mesorhizobium sp. NFR06]SFP98019.1 hypothetical protein SAMN03159463_05302 [Mesorhizobium sp. NFR06]